jgi:hypothetical protein
LYEEFDEALIDGVEVLERGFCREGEGRIGPRRCGG